MAELKRLDGEFQFPDPSCSQLDVKLGVPQPTQILVDPVLHLLDLQSRGGSAARRVQSRLQLPQRAFSQLPISGRVARLDERLTLPVAGPGPVVGQERSPGMNQLPVLAPRAQPQIHPEDLSL